MRRAGAILLRSTGSIPPKPNGCNHPHFNSAELLSDLLLASKFERAKADDYTPQFAAFLEAFARVIALPELPHYFFIDGGALSLENALKAAMD